MTQPEDQSSPRRDGSAETDGRAQPFREAVQAGLDDLDSGRYAAVAIEDLPSFIDGLSPRLSQGSDEGITHD